MSFLNHIRQSPHRNKLEHHLNRVLPALVGPILDIGSKNRRYDNLLTETPIAIDLVENSQHNVQKGDIMQIQFPESSFQSVLCLEVLEYVDDPVQAISEMYRVLAPGGTLVLSVPFMFKEHEDKLRYTASYLDELLQDFSIKAFHAVGGSYTTVLTILWGKIKSLSFTPFRYLCTALFLPLLVFRIPVSEKSKRYASGYFIVAQKV